MFSPISLGIVEIWNCIRTNVSSSCCVASKPDVWHWIHKVSLTISHQHQMDRLYQTQANRWHLQRCSPGQLGFVFEKDNPPGSNSVCWKCYLTKVWLYFFRHLLRYNEGIELLKYLKLFITSKACPTHHHGMVI